MGKVRSFYDVFIKQYTHNYSADEVALKNPDGSLLVWTDGSFVFRKVFEGLTTAQDVSNGYIAYRTQSEAEQTQIIEAQGFVVSQINNTQYGLWVEGKESYLFNSRALEEGQKWSVVILYIKTIVEELPV